ncbi:MAG: REP-associated tyrosine transposase [Promethearchaeota archaeon]
MPTLRIYQENENLMHFVTITVIEWIDIFTNKEYFKIITDSLKYCRKNKGLLLYEYVIMTNHIHLIVAAKDGHKLSQIISDFKKYTSREIFKLLAKDNRKYILGLIKTSYYKKKGYENQVWQRENFPEAIDTEGFFESKVNYIHNNPVKKGYIEKPEDCIYSSAKDRILGERGVIKLDDYDAL